MRDRDPDRPPLGPTALSIMAWSRVADLRTMADKTAALVRETLQPLPILPLDPIRRERLLAIRLSRQKIARDAF